MELAFDHLVHFTNNPVLAAEQLSKLGIHSAKGGEHPAWGTYNALAYFGLSYLEFLGIKSREQADKAALENDLIQQAVHLLPSQEGFGRVAFRTNDIDKAAVKMKENGLRVEGPVRGQRRRQDGFLLEWSMLFVKDPSEEEKLALPFFIQWGQPDEEREKDLKPHQNNSLCLTEIVFAIHNSQRTAVKWSEWFGLELQPVEGENEAYKLRLKGGDLIFKSSKSCPSVETRLERKGEGPYLMKLSGEKKVRETEVAGSYIEIN